MVTSTEIILTALKLATVALGFLVVFLGWRAYRGSRRKPLLWLTVGMAIMTIGAIAEGAAYQGFGLDLDNSHLFEAVVTLIAFAFLVYSLYA